MTHTPNLLCTFFNLCQCNVSKTLFCCPPRKCVHKTHLISHVLFVECLEQLLPAVTAIINQSLQIGVFLSVFKEVIVKPLLKKPSLEPNSLKNYRPISNVSFLSKVTGKKSSSHNSLHTSTPTTSFLLPSQPIGQGTVLKLPCSIR